MTCTVAMIVVPYGSRAEVERQRENLTSVWRSAGRSDRLIIWDNSGHLTKMDAAQLVVRSSPNVGFARAVNSAAALAKDSEWLFIVNPDISFSSDILESVFAKIRKGSHDVWVPDLVNPDGTPQTSEGSNFLRTPAAMMAEKFGKKIRPRNARLYFSGAAFAIRRELFFRLGGLDERFFLFGEDVDLSMRLNDIGASIKRDPSVRLVHEGSQGWRSKSRTAFGYFLASDEVLTRKYFGNTPTLGVRLATYVSLAVRGLRGELPPREIIAVRAARSTALRRDASVRVASRVTVYDPNFLNPYGAELTQLLRTVDLDAKCWCAPGSSNRRVLASPEERRTWLAPPAERGRSFAYSALRVLGPLALAVAAVARRRTIVVVWVRDKADSSILAAASKLTRVISVDHNPPGTGRDADGSPQARLRLSRTNLVVHSSRLLTRMPSQHREQTAVVPHPAYLGWTSIFVPPGSNAKGSHDIFTAILVGAARSDKGGHLQEELASRLSAHGIRCRFVGLQAGELADRLKGIDGVEVQGVVNDEELAEALTYSDVMIAPYTNATQSGSVTLAFSVGLPTLGFASGGLQDLLSPRATVPVGDVQALVELVVQFSHAPFFTYSRTVNDLTSQVAWGWRRLLTRAALP
jgi:GT2 family glycosyltransferase